jgi:hypothetical protein
MIGVGRIAANASVLLVHYASVLKLWASGLLFTGLSLRLPRCVFVDRDILADPPHDSFLNFHSA